jgi:hypothetical protein
LESIIIAKKVCPSIFTVLEGSRTTGKAAVPKYVGEEIGKKILSYAKNIFGNAAFKGNLAFAPIVGLTLGALNRKVT